MEFPISLSGLQNQAIGAATRAIGNAVNGITGGLFGMPITLPQSRSMGGISPQVAIEEVHNDELVITDHPVEQSAEISDHAYKRPSELVLRYGWSNSSEMAGGDEGYVKHVYEQLLGLQATMQPFSVTTGKRLYNNMMLVGIQITTDEKSETSLFVTARLRQIIITQTSTTTLPPVDQQALPQSTADIVQQGAQNLLPAIPSPGGALPLIGSITPGIAPSFSAALSGALPAVLGKIPLINNPQMMNISLNGVVHQLTAKFAPASGWVADIADKLGNPLARGLPLVTGSDLLGQLKYLGIGNGVGLHMQSDFAADAVPTFANLGINSNLFATRT